MQTTIERVRRGENRKKLTRVFVVGVSWAHARQCLIVVKLQATCASSALGCLDGMKFPFVLLDECCQMTEPTALLPITRHAACFTDVG